MTFLFVLLQFFCLKNWYQHKMCFSGNFYSLERVKYWFCLQAKYFFLKRPFHNGHSWQLSNPIIMKTVRSYKEPSLWSYLEKSLWDSRTEFCTFKAISVLFCVLFLSTFWMTGQVFLFVWSFREESYSAIGTIGP